MRIHKQNKIFDDFPSLFRNETEDGGLKWKSTAFSFSCEDGWYDIIYNLCRDIQKIVDKYEANDFIVEQVKEKFGGLRFYAHCSNNEAYEEIRKSIDDAESRSFQVCEFCGNPGRQGKIGNYWIKTLCDGCESGYERDNLVRRLLKAWDLVGDERLGQLIANSIAKSSSDLFFIDNYELIKLIEEHAKKVHEWKK